MSRMDPIGGRKLPLGEDEDVVSVGGSSIVVDIDDDDDDAFMKQRNAPKEQHQQQPVSHRHAQEQQQQRAGPGSETAAPAIPETAKGGGGGDGAMPSAREPGSVEKEPSRSTPSQFMTFCGRFAHLLSCTLAVREPWVYSADALQTDLTQIPTEGKNMDTMVEAVKTVCKQHGVKVVKSSSKKQAERQVACTLSCVHGMPNRQGERRKATNGNNQKRRRISSGRTGCDCKIYVRWPAQSSDSKYPRMTTMHLEHNHDVDREAVNAKEAQLGALLTPIKETSAKLTDVGMQLSDQAVVLEALHNRAVNPKVMQNAVSQHRQGGREFDDQDFLRKVRECTKDGGVYDVKLENGRRTHCFWMTAEQFKAARRTAPDVFLQDADAAMTRAAGEVFEDAKKRRCAWNLDQNIIKNLNSVLGSSFQDFLDQFHKTRGRLTESWFEEEYAKLVETFPRAKSYMEKLHADRERWAVYASVLVFSIASFTTNRASLCSVFDFFSKAMEKARDRAILRSAPQLFLPSVQQSNVADFWLGDAVLAACKFALGAWPYRFMVEEVTMASVFCSSPVNAVLEGSARGEALSKFEFIGMKVVDVVDVALRVYNNDGTDKRYVVLGMTDGSHLCSCRTLQELGVCCRHFRAAMCLSRKYKLHVGILKQHWLVERGRKPTNCLKETTAAVSSGVETVTPEALRALVQQFKAGVVQAARLGSSAESSGPLPVANPEVVRLPSARGKGKRQRGSHESGNVVGSAVRAFAQSR
eukprot:jgi/Undpi1/9425/HiC_scaffold_27.g11882.m1